MPKNPKRLPHFTQDADGTAIAHLPLASGGSAILEATVLEELIQRGFTLNWTFNLSGSGYGYVRTRTASRNLVSVPRELVGARAREIVRYRNGNRRDLRRSNLYVTGGGRVRKAVS